MKYILIRLSDGKWVKILSKDVDAICIAQTNDKDQLHIERHIYSGTEDNITIDDNKIRKWELRERYDNQKIYEK